MKEKPILFSAPMVRANREGRKTQTRRIVNPQPDGRPVFFEAHQDWFVDGGLWCRRCPYGVPGDRLWVRETWASAYSQGCWGTLFAADETFAQGARGHAKGPHFNADDLPPVKWRPSIFMPRWACRNVYEITEVRVQRLQDIGEDDARAEGFTSDPIRARVNGAPSVAVFFDPISWYAALWDGINGDAPWSSNPWVWAISYRPVSP